MDEYVSSLVASTLVLSSKDNEQGSSDGNFHTECDNIRQPTPIRMVNMNDSISHEVEETVITNFLQFALGDENYHHPEDIKTIERNHIRIGTFTTDNDELHSLRVDTRASKPEIGKKKMKRILGKLSRRCMPAICSMRVFRLSYCRNMHLP